MTYQFKTHTKASVLLTFKIYHFKYAMKFTTQQHNTAVSKFMFHNAVH